MKGWQPPEAGIKDEAREGGDRAETQHSHGNPGHRAIPKQQVARWEVGDTKLVHHVALSVQDPAHCKALALGQVQSHLQRQRPCGGPATGQREPWEDTWVAAVLHPL